MLHTLRKMTLPLVILLCMTGRGFAVTALSSVTITGAVQSSGSTWDAGTVTATLNGVTVSFAYGQFSTPASIASALGALISQNCNMPVYAKANGNVLTFYQKGSNALTSASITSTSGNPSLFSGGSFGVNGVSGGMSTPVLDHLSLPEGPPQMGLVIYGSDLAGATVTIGGRPATVIVPWNGASITVQVPSGLLGPADVVVSNGLSNSSKPFKVDEPFPCN